MRCLITFLMLIMPFTSSYLQGKRQLANDTINQHEAVQLNKLASACRLNFFLHIKKWLFILVREVMLEGIKVAISPSVLSLRNIILMR